MSKAERVCVGAIAGAFGVRGEARIKSFTDDPKAIATYGPLESEDRKRSFTVKLSRTMKDGFAARVSGIETREEAEALKGTRLYVPRAALPEPEDDAFYYADLIGLTLKTPEGEPLGKIKAIQDYGAGDLLEFSPVGGGETRFIPFTREAVPEVDIANGRVIAILQDDDEDTVG